VRHLVPLVRAAQLKVLECIKKFESGSSDEEVTEALDSIFDMLREIEREVLAHRTGGSLIEQKRYERLLARIYRPLAK